MALFPGLPGELVPEEIFFWTYGARQDIRGRHTDHPVGRHSIRTNQRPTSNIPIFTPDALRATTLPFYPGLGRAPNMLAYIPPWRGSCSSMVCKILMAEDRDPII